MSILNAIAASASTSAKGVFSEYAENKFGHRVPKVCNGVQAPQRSGKCANVWLEVAGQLSTLNRMPSVSEVVAALPSENVNNVKIEYYRAVKFIQGLPAFWKDAGLLDEQAPVSEVPAPTPTKSRKSA